MRRIFLTFLLLTSLTLVGCKEEEPIIEAPTSLDGLWQADCQVYDVNVSGLTSNSIAGADFVHSSILYLNDEVCTTPSFTSDFTGTWTIGTPYAIPTGEQVYPTDSTFSSAVVTPSDAAGAAAMNAMTYCGFTDWAAGVAKDVTAAVNVTSPCNGPPMSGTYYNISFVSADLSYYQMGVTNDPVLDGSAPELRPETLDPTKYWKQP